MKWDLTKLFKNEEAFYNKISFIKNELNDIENYINLDINSDSLLKLLNYKWYLKEEVNNILIYGSLRYYQDVTSERTIQMKEESEKLNFEVDNILKSIDKKILDTGSSVIFSYVESNEQLKLYSHYLDNLFRIKNHIQNNEINNKIEQLNNKINNELKKYNTLLRDMKYDSIIIDGKETEITSANYAKYMMSRSRNTRRDTYLIVNKAFENKSNEFLEILNSIYKNRVEISELEQYDSVLEKVLFEENINIEVIDNLISSVNENLSLIQNYLILKAKHLNINDPHLYDLSTPLSDISTKFTIEEAQSIIFNSLKPLGDNYLEIIEYLLNNGYVDSSLDSNKHQSIVFSWNTYSFMNFRESYGDVKNLIHELGHIVNYYLSKKYQPYLYEDSTIFVGETASIVNEILLNRYLSNKTENTETKLFYLSKEIENYFTSVYKQTMYTELENFLYKEIKEKGNFTKEEIENYYFNLIKRYYGNDIIYDDCSKIEWMRLGHLFRWSYYPYKYATGLLIANIVVNSLTNTNELELNKYLEFLSSGSNTYSLELLKILNIDLMDDKIINLGFEDLRKDLNKFKRI